ncbi:MAG TPA: polysaccharide deacetylase family protein [Acidimicrobiia bacterium]|nr:polysaccharide deacetylase family protein [Acidimicrobiia bacterium]
MTASLTQTDRGQVEPRPVHGHGLMANTGALFLSRIIIAALGWAGTIIIIRSLSHTAWGEYAFVFSFLSMLAIVSNIVNSRVALHGILGEDSERFAGTYVLLRGALGLLAYVLALGFAVVAGYSSTVVAATAVGGITVLVATPSVGLDAIFTVYMRMDRVAVAAVLGQVVQFLLTGALALLGGTVVLFTIPAVVFEVVAILWKLRGLRGLQRVRYVPDVRRWGKLLKASIPIAIGAGAATFYYSLDSVMLSKLDTFRAVGTYGIAYKFAGIVGFLPWVLCGVLLGLLVRAWPNHPDEFFHALRRATAALFVISLLIVIEFVLFAGPAIRLLYGANYAAAAGATRLVIGGECLGFFTTLGVTVFAAVERNRFYPVAAVAGLLVNFALNLVVIPRYSYHGAAWVTLGTELLVATIIWVPLLRLLGRSPLAGSVLRKAAAIVAVTLAVGYEANRVVWWPATAVLIAVVFVVGLHLARVPGEGGLIALFRDDEPGPVGPAGDPEVGAPAPSDRAGDRRPEAASTGAARPRSRGLATVRRDVGRGTGALAAARLLVGGCVRARGAVVLGYHDVHDDPEHVTDLLAAPARFRADLLHAEAWGLRIVGLGELCDRAEAGAPLDGLAAVSFDDGLRGVTDHAVPILLELDLAATVFAVSGASGTAPGWWQGAGPVMTDRELVELAASGVTIGSHSVTHVDLPSLDDATLAHELADSRARLEDLVQAPVDLLAYPYGHHDARVRRAARDAGYRAAFTFLNGRWTGDVDRFQIPRLTMSGQSTRRLAYQLARPASSWPDHQLDAVTRDAPAPVTTSGPSSEPAAVHGPPPAEP